MQGLIPALDLQQLGQLGEVGEVHLHLFPDLVGRREEQVDGHRFVQRLHDLLGRIAGARGAEVREVGAHVAFGGDVGAAEGEHQGEGDAQAGQQRRPHPADLQHRGPGHAPQRHLHEEDGQRPAQPQRRPQRGQRPRQPGQSLLQRLAAHLRQQVRVEEVQPDRHQADHVQRQQRPFRQAVAGGHRRLADGPGGHRRQQQREADQDGGVADATGVQHALAQEYPHHPQHVGNAGEDRRPVAGGVRQRHRRASRTRVAQNRAK